MSACKDNEYQNIGCSLILPLYITTWVSTWRQPENFWHYNVNSPDGATWQFLKNHRFRKSRERYSVLRLYWRNTTVNNTLIWFSFNQLEHITGRNLEKHGWTSSTIRRSFPKTRTGSVVKSMGIWFPCPFQYVRAEFRRRNSRRRFVPTYTLPRLVCAPT